MKDGVVQQIEIMRYKRTRHSVNDQDLSQQLEKVVRPSCSKMSLEDEYIFFSSSREVYYQKWLPISGSIDV